MPVQIWKPGDGGTPTGIPYQKEYRDVGVHNYGCFDLKRYHNRIRYIPEIREYPELITTLEILNSSESFVWSIGCDTDFGDPLVAACYIQLVFECVCFNGRDNYEMLFDKMMKCIVLRKSGSIIELSLKEVFFRAPHDQRAWSATLRINGRGGTPEEARKLWTKALEAVSDYFARESDVSRPYLNHPDCVFVTNFREPLALGEPGEWWSIPPEN